MPHVRDDPQLPLCRGWLHEHRDHDRQHQPQVRRSGPVGLPPPLGRAGMTLTLPWPPSTNTYWRHVLVRGRPRTLVSERGRAYKAQVGRRKAQQAPGQCYPLGQSLKAVVALYEPDRRKRDVDNTLKALLDALQAAGVFESDSQISDLRVWRAGYDKPLGRVEVTIEVLE